MSKRLAVAVIRCIHALVVAYVLFYPYAGTKLINYATGMTPADNNVILTARRHVHMLLDVLYIVTCTSILFHWYFNSDACILTTIEEWLRGKKVDGGFIHSIISPIYKFPANRIRRITHFIMLFNMAMVSAKLFKQHISVLTPIVIV